MQIDLDKCQPMDKLRRHNRTTLALRGLSATAELLVLALASLTISLTILSIRRSRIFRAAVT